MDLAEEIGSTLRRARRERGLTLPAAAADLEVPERFLVDLEEGRLGEFGPALHADAHLRVYARHLGLDDARLLETASGSEPDAPLAAGGPRGRVALLAAGSLLALGALIAVALVLLLDGGADLARPEEGVSADAEEDRTEVRGRVVEPAPEPTDAGGGGSGKDEAGGEGGEQGVDDDGDGDDGDAEGDRSVGDAGDDGVRADGPEEGGEQGEDADASAGEGAPDRPGTGLRVQILDGVGDSARVADVRATLEGLGYEIVFVDIAAGTHQRTTVLRDEGLADEADALLAVDERFTAAGADPGLGAPADLHVIVGADWPEG